MDKNNNFQLEHKQIKKLKNISGLMVRHLEELVNNAGNVTKDELLEDNIYQILFKGSDSLLTSFIKISANLQKLVTISKDALVDEDLYEPPFIDVDMLKDYLSSLK